MRVTFDVSILDRPIRALPWRALPSLAVLAEGKLSAPDLTQPLRNLARRLVVDASRRWYGHRLLKSFARQLRERGFLTEKQYVAALNVAGGGLRGRSRRFGLPEGGCLVCGLELTRRQSLARRVGSCCYPYVLGKSWTPVRKGRW